jgi:FtsP/CotA-like multicopper oxidase with cupredoxin domain
VSTYDLNLAEGTISPDGYPWAATVYNQGTSYLGPTIEVFENDLVQALVSNNGESPQATHCESAREPPMGWGGACTGTHSHKYGSKQGLYC